MANEVMDELGFSKGETTHYLSQHDPEEEAKEKAEAEASKKAEGADAAAAKPAGEEAKAPAAEGEKPAGKADKAAESKKPAAKKPVNKYNNWWKKEEESAEQAYINDKKGYEDGTPDHILTNAHYMKEVGRLLPEFYQDPAYEAATRNSTIPIDQSDITEEKEREGYYPTDLDQETQGYNYGDKVSTSGYWRSWWDASYRSKKYNDIYNPETRVYNDDNTWHPVFGWGFKEQAKIAPAFDPNAHYQTPYYDYDDSRNQRDYWSRMRRGPWGW